MMIRRADLLSKFTSCLPVRAHKNAFFVVADGGIGKTTSLRQIIDAHRNTDKWWIPGLDASQSSAAAIIDFAHTKHSSVAGLRRAIANAFGPQYFGQFHELDVQYVQGESAPKEAERHVTLAERIDAVFFKDFAQAIQSNRANCLMCFDTFERVAVFRVGQWFVDRFLASEDTQDCFIVFAGRTTPILPLNTVVFPLGGFTDVEYDEFRKEHPLQVTREESWLRGLTDDKPLLLELAAQLPRNGLLPKTKEEFEFGVASQLKEGSLDDRISFLDLAILWRRFDPEVARELNTSLEDLEAKLLDDSDDLLLGLLEPTIVKYRIADRTVTLHDEVRRILSDYAHADHWDPARRGLRLPWFERKAELYRKIIHNWYPRRITELELSAEPDAREHRIALIAEYVEYLLEESDTDFLPAIQAYASFFLEAQRNVDLDLSEKLVNALLTSHSRLAEGYDLLIDHAEWLFRVGQYGAASVIYREIARSYAEPPSRRLDALAQLGSALQAQGSCTFPPLGSSADTVPYNFEERLALASDAQSVFELGLDFSKVTNHTAYTSAFSVYLGRVFESTGDPEAALRCYDKAASVPQLPDHDSTRAMVNLTLAELEARLGTYGVALLRVDEARRALQGSDARQSDVARAEYSAAQVLRYSGDFEKALLCYQRALDLANADDVDRAVYLQGMGACYLESGRRYRLGLHQNWAVLAAEPMYKGLSSLLQSLKICRTTRQSQNLPSLFSRLGRVFIEISAIVQAVSSPISDEVLTMTLDSLVLAANGLRLYEEESWRDRGVALVPPFDKLSTEEKAQRLFEISFREADEQERYDITLDSISDAALSALTLGKSADVEKYISEVFDLRSFRYHQEIAHVVFQLIRHHLDFDQGRFARAVEGYCMSPIELARKQGYAAKRLEVQTYEIIRRLRGLHGKYMDAAPMTHKILEAWQEGGLKALAPTAFFRLQQFAMSLPRIGH